MVSSPSQDVEGPENSAGRGPPLAMALTIHLDDLVNTLLFLPHFLVFETGIWA